MKTQVTIDLPDGWELADSRLRTPKKGEWLIVPGESSPRQALFDWYNTPTFIVRRIATEYVNVKLRRTTATHFSELTPFDRPGGSHNELIDACREALRERCGIWACGGRLCSDQSPDGEVSSPHDPGLGIRVRCTRDPGHAGKHGV